MASCCSHHRFDDILVAGAATQIALQFFACRSGIKTIGMPFQNIDRGHDHAGCTETALQTVLISEGLLHGMQGVGSEALDCRYVAVTHLDSQNAAGLHRDVIDMNDAGATLARIATRVRAGQSEVVSEKVDEQLSVFDLGLNWLSIHMQIDS